MSIYESVCEILDSNYLNKFNETLKAKSVGEIMDFMNEALPENLWNISCDEFSDMCGESVCLAWFEDNQVKMMTWDVVYTWDDVFIEEDEE